MINNDEDPDYQHYFDEWINLPLDDLRTYQEYEAERRRSIVVTGSFAELFKPGLAMEVFSYYEQYKFEK